MNNITKNISFLLGLLCLAMVFSNSAAAQEIYYSYQFKLDLTGATEVPKLGGTPNIDLPEKAKKNGVEGTLKVIMTLAKNGQVTDIKFEQTLPDGLEQAVIDAYKTFNFQPAKRNGEPIDVKMYLTYTISAVYDERDKNAQKPKITDQPDALYPADQLAEGRKGEVRVGVLFNKDGTVKLLNIQSTMPREFDNAAKEAAEKLKFEPAIHKKSNKKISMKMWVIYKFKP